MSGASLAKAAHLDFLTIFRPDLGVDEARQQDQILFYYSSAGVKAQKYNGADSKQRDTHETENERLRQVGLAQGLVAFARGFSNGQSVDSIETEKHRIVLSEIEHGWWILASINLTALPSYRSQSTKIGTGVTTPNVEYSSREVSPPSLLVQQLLCAHRVFLLHQSHSLGELYDKISRHRLCALLEIYWTQFARNWDVLLHGNPAVDVYAGIKLAAGGELGIGVGEEEWGSGEREVLEGLIEHTEGLEELVVTRFDQQDGPNMTLESDTIPATWLGTRQYAGPADGILFSGAGLLSRDSLRSIYDWTSSIYFYGEDAYGVKTSPISSRKALQRKMVPGHEDDEDGSYVGTEEASGETHELDSTVEVPSMPQYVPQSLVSEVEISLKEATLQAEVLQDAPVKQPEALEQSDTLMKYLTLGYGTLWGGSSSRPRQTSPSTILPSGDGDSGANPLSSGSNISNENVNLKVKDSGVNPAASVDPNGGHYLIGLKGDLSLKDDDQEEDEQNWNTRLVLRTMYVDMLEKQAYDHSDGSSAKSGESTSTDQHSSANMVAKRLRVVVYVHRPFIFVFLFDPTTSSLSIPSFFHTLHKHLMPLHKPLINSTSPDMVARRLQAILPHQPPPPPDRAIYDIIYDSRNLTVHTSIPSIPLPGTLAAEGFGSTSSASASDQAWTRVEALNVHAQILATYVETRRRTVLTEKERTVKTSRGWWVLWMQIGTREGEADGGCKEAFLVRRADDQGPTRSGKGGVSSTAQGMGAGFGLGRLIGMGGGSSAPESGPAGQNPSVLSEGIGVDARRYVESLLSLNR